MMTLRPNFLRLLTGLILLGAALWLPQGAHAADSKILWKDQIYERDWYDTDIKRILTSILDQAGLQYNFKEGINKSVTISFKNIQLVGAFNRLVEENNLSYDYNESTKTITIGPATEISNELFSVQYLKTKKQIQDAKTQFKIGGSFEFDEANKIVRLEGDARQVKQLKNLIDLLEKKLKDEAEASGIPSFHTAANTPENDRCSLINSA